MATTVIDWNDPTARLALIERVGAAEYNRLISAWIAENPIRPVASRFGTLYAVGTTGRAFSTRAEAEQFLQKRTHLEELAQAALTALKEHGWGSDEQIEAENAFGAAAEQMMTPEQICKWQAYCLKATSEEIIQSGLQYV